MKLLVALLTLAVLGCLHAKTLNKNEELKELDDTILNINIGVSKIKEAIETAMHKKKAGEDGSGGEITISEKNGEGGGEKGGKEGDFDISDHIFEVNENDHEENNLLEGDMMVSDDQVTKYEGVQGDLIKQRYRHWAIPGKIVNIPYVYDSTASAKARTAFGQAVYDFRTKTCIRFVPRSNQAYFIRVLSGRGCYSYVGKQYRFRFRGQPLSLGNDCETKGIAIHELMHAIGYYHEQSRPDRGDYITIKYENILPGRSSNFDERNSDNQGTEYDYNSIMHYGPTAFSKNGRDTIELNEEKRGKIGNRAGFSPIDLQSINAKYCARSDCYDQHVVCPYYGMFCNSRIIFFSFLRNFARKYCKSSCEIC